MVERETSRGVGMKLNRLGLLAALLLAGLTAGCGNSERLYDVTGTVTWNGQPVPMGLVFFDPDAVQGGAGLQGYATIKDGKFTTAVEGRGLAAAGKYGIRVLGYDGKPREELPFGQPLFDEHQESRELPAANSELTLTVPVKKKRT